MSDSQAVNAGLGRRLAAMFYDSLLAIAILLAVTAANLALSVALQGEQPIKDDPFISLGSWHLPSLWLSMYLFFCGFWVRIGQTLGMQAWRLKIVTAGGDDIGWRHASFRFLAAHLSLLTLGLGWLWVLFDKEKRCLHGRLSGTKTIVLAKR